MELETKQHGAFLQVFEHYLWVRLVWVAGRWLIGLIMIFSGFTSVWLRRLGDEISLAVLLLGLSVFLLGPILWYILNALNRPARQRPKML